MTESLRGVEFDRVTIYSYDEQALSMVERLNRTDPDIAEAFEQLLKRYAEACAEVDRLGILNAQLMAALAESMAPHGHVFTPTDPP